MKRSKYPEFPYELDEEISKYFKWREALWLPSVRGYAVPTPFQLDNIRRQAKELDKVREFLGAPINVHCWLRPAWYNRMLGGAKRSAHIDGTATDFSVEGYTVKEARDLLLTKEGRECYNGRGELNTSKHIHLDLRGKHWFYG